MKMKYIAGAIAALCSVTAFAAGTPVSPTTTPDAVFYIVGASAQKPGIQALAYAKQGATTVNPFFDVAKGDPLYITSSVTPDKLADGITVDNSGPNTLISKSIAYYGWDKRDNSKKLLVVINTANGSAAGVNQLLSPGAGEPEAQSVSVGPNANCVSNTGAAKPSDYKCGSFQAYEADVAFSDVYASELSGLTGDTSNLNEVKQIGLQGFGIIVSPSLYPLLQAQNIADGLLPSTCAGSSTADCQPSISKTQYFNAISSAGVMHSIAALVPGVQPAPTGLLSIQRRVQTSGTQASSGIYFLNSPCGIAYGSNFVAVSASPSDGTYEVIENSQSDDVIANVSAATGTKYALGLVSLEKADSTLGNAKWVKLNGVSPNYAYGTSAEGNHRAVLIDGRYDLAYEMAAYSGNTQQSDLVDTLLGAITDPLQSNLPGVAYMSGSVAGKSARFSRNQNNCNVLQ